MSKFQKKASGAALSKKQAKQVKRIISSDSETKYFDSNSTIAQQYGSGAGILSADVTGMAQGAGAQQRLGDQVSPKSLMIRWTTEQQTTNPNSTSRILVFQYRPSNTPGAPAVADILDVGPGGTVNVWSDYNNDKRHTFTILYDKMWAMSGNVGSSSYVQTFKKLVKLEKKAAKVNYEQGVNTGDHHIYIFIIGSNPNGATGQLVTLASRLKYKDM